MSNKKAVNFEVNYGSSLTGGLTMPLVPVEQGIVDYVNEMENFYYDDGICINETAFGFIERCIAENVRDNYCHWGITKIDNEEWEIIVTAVKDVVSDWRNAKSIIDVMASLNRFEDDGFYQKLYFEKTRKEFLNFAEEFLLWGNGVFEKYKTMVVLGI
ncbi:hypothetical protein [Bartonella sp. HY761]|uniref:hypothetical protein n=1 Tax=Bartonella sp. HY761 TaxID=2979330 RepID=UPI00220BBFC3|nr:hypothetical protein [Bartonella sp. HY761]UXN06537.1 hypothetical protein N6A79_00480 [Bartonella sp. HY761]